MNLEYHPTPEREARLRAIADERGIEPDEVIDEFIDSLFPLIMNETVPQIDDDPDALKRALYEMRHRSPEERQAMRERALKKVIPGRELPPGQTIFDAVMGKWPGDETDEQIQEALKRLS